MEENITVCGKQENNMEKVIFIMQKLKLGKGEFGMKEKELDGFNLNNYEITFKSEFY